MYMCMRVLAAVHEHDSDMNPLTYMYVHAHVYVCAELDTSNLRTFIDIHVHT
jgi:hypothetical protein